MEKGKSSAKKLIFCKSFYISLVSKIKKQKQSSMVWYLKNHAKDVLPLLKCKFII